MGDNVGDIAGMGADLFGSFAESTCAALVISSVSSLGANHVGPAMAYPMLISATGLLVCMATTFLATDIRPARVVSEIESTLKQQLIVSTTLATPAVLAVTLLALPPTFTGIFSTDPSREVHSWQLFVCVAVGLWGGLIIGIATEYYTSNRYRPVQAWRGGIWWAWW